MSCATLKRRQGLVDVIISRTLVTRQIQRGWAFGVRAARQVCTRSATITCTSFVIVYLDNRYKVNRSRAHSFRFPGTTATSRGKQCSQIFIRQAARWQVMGHRTTAKEVAGRRQQRKNKNKEKKKCKTKEQRWRCCVFILLAVHACCSTQILKEWRQ